MKPGVKSPPALILINIKAKRSGSLAMGAPLTFVSIIWTDAKQGTVMSNETKEAHAAETKVVRS
jgi:hypothetical protein